MDFPKESVQNTLANSISDIGTAANIYGHLETRQKQKMAAKLSGCISG